MLSGLLISDEFKYHQTAVGHPECSERIDAARVGLEATDLFATSHPISLRSASTQELQLCHDWSYIEETERLIRSGTDALSSGDVSVCSDSGRVARLAVGSVLNAVDLILSGKIANAFCAIRPPGHHATPTQAMGFCIYNNVSIAARYAQHHYGISRVAIIDWDVHHGNGTQDIFYEDPTVLYCSTHQAPWYPGTGWVNERGNGAGEGFTLNFPIPAGTSGKKIISLYSSQILPAVRAFKPELIIISAGFDARIKDPLGRLCLTDNDFSDLTLRIRDVAASVCQERLLSVLEGGYNLPGLTSAITAHVNSLR